MKQTTKTVAIFSTGDMGAGVGAALRQHGFRAITALDDRSERSRGLAAKAKIEDLGNLAAAVAAADLVLSILPPDRALENAKAVAAAMVERDVDPAFADCNAISPGRAREIAGIIAAAGGSFIDGGIIGLAPGKGPAPTRFYVSGPELAAITALDGAGLTVKSLGPEIGAASGMKMCYASLTKGQFTLYTAVWIVAQVLGLTDALREEFEYSQQDTLTRMRRLIPRLPADAGRWIGEMEEIARTYKDAGVTTGFHDGAVDIFRLLAKTPFAEETRETLDPNRTLEDAIAVYAAYRNK